MNHSWEAYENGLKLLSNTPFPKHPDYANICTLQSSLQECISQARAHMDTRELCAQRKHIIANLNSIMLQIKGENFIDLCMSNSALLIYIVHAYKSTQRAYMLFSGIEQIWADQCQNTCKQFYQRPALEYIATGASLSSVDLHHIDKLIIDLIRLIESFEIYCPPSQKITGSLQDKRNEIHSKLIQCIGKIQYFNNSAFKEFISWYQEVNLSNAELSPLKQDESLSPHNNGSKENHNAPSKTQADIAEVQKWNLNQEPIKMQGEMTHESASENISQPTSEEHIDLVKFTEMIEQAFDMEELRSLCREIEWARKQDGITEPFSLDTLPGDTLPGKARELVDYFQRRGELIYVIEAVRKRRPQLFKNVFLSWRDREVF